MTTADRPRAWNSTLPVRSASLARAANGARHPAVATLDGTRIPVRQVRQRRKSRPQAGFSRAVKLAVRKRAGKGIAGDAECEACGCWLGPDGGDYQHRAARGSGGCRLAVINGPANCALMCRPCHRKAEDRDPHMAMDAGGFWVKHGTTPEYDPRNVRIMLHGAGGGMTVWLTEAGGYSTAPPKGAAA